MEDGTAGIWVVPASGGAAERVVDWPDHEFSPDWSPDAEKIAFVSEKLGAQMGGGPDLDRSGLRGNTHAAAGDAGGRMVA